MNSILQVENLSKKFGMLTAVDQINLDVQKGNVYGLLGPNGSGKSTTLGMLLHVINPSSGNWTWFGEKSNHNTLKNIGAIIERPSFYPYLSARKNLEVIALIKGVPFNKIDEKLKLVGLLERANNSFKQYSLGMKQRLAIAASLLNDPEVLILDEPTNGLDPKGIIQIRNLIIDISKKGTTIIVASHMLDEIEKICSHVIILKKGKTLYCGAVQAMSNSAGYFELRADDIGKLQETLNTWEKIDTTQLENDTLLVYPKTTINATEINKFLAEKNIFLSHLVQGKVNLENQFLEITKN